MKSNPVVLRRSKRISDKLTDIPGAGHHTNHRAKPAPPPSRLNFKQKNVQQVSFTAPDSSTSSSKSSNSTTPLSNLSSASTDRPTSYTCVSVGDVVSLGLRIVKPLGHGAYGTVYRVIDQKRKSVFALKIAHIRSDKLGARSREEEVYAIIHSHNDTARSTFLEFHGSFDFNERRCILVEHCTMSLRDLQAKDHIFPLPIRHIQHVAVQLILGLDYLHRLQLIHCDVKPENILLCEGDTSMISEPNRCGVFAHKHILTSIRVKIGDLGGTMAFAEAGMGIIGSNAYRAPEIIIGITWDHTVDTFALGCVLAELYLQRPLFRVEKNPTHKLAIIEAIVGLFPPDMAMQVAQERADLFKKTAENIWKINFPPNLNDSESESDTDARTTNEIAVLPNLQDLIEYPALRALIEEMLHVNFAQRISLDLALDHYFFDDMA